MKKRTIGIVITLCLAVVMLIGAGSLAIKEFHKAAARKQITTALEEAVQMVMSDAYSEELTKLVESEREIERTRPTSKIWLLLAIRRFDSEESMVTEYTALLYLLWGEDWTYVIEAYGLDKYNSRQFMFNMLQDELSSAEYSIYNRSIWKMLDNSHELAETLGWIWFGQNEDRLDSILSDREMMALYRLTSNCPLHKNDDQIAQSVAQKLGGQDANVITRALVERGLLPESNRPALKDPAQDIAVPRNDTDGPGAAEQPSGVTTTHQQENPVQN